MQDATKPKHKTNKLTEITMSFVEHMDGLDELVPFTFVFLKIAINGRQRKYNDLLQEFGEEHEKGIFTVNTADANIRIDRAQQKLLKTRKGGFLIEQNLLVAFVSQYDAFLYSFMSKLYELNQERLRINERQFTYKEVIGYETIDKFRDAVIEKEVENLLRESHYEQLVSLEKKFDVKLTENIPELKIFLEATERRNIFVHNGGKVSQSYINNCKKYGIDCDTLSIGESLNIDRNYLEQAYQSLFTIGIKLSQVLWRHLYKKDKNELLEADDCFNEIAFESIVNEKYKMAINLLEFAKAYIKNSDSTNYDYRCINLAQAYKWNGDNTKCLQLLNETDWNNRSDIIRMAVESLKDNFVEVVDIYMDRVFKKDDMGGEIYKTFPVFKKLASNKDFLKKYKKLYKREFLEIQIEQQIKL